MVDMFVHGPQVEGHCAGMCDDLPRVPLFDVVGYSKCMQSRKDPVHKYTQFLKSAPVVIHWQIPPTLGVTATAIPPIAFDTTYKQP
jgi:hypothetical protein